MRILLTLAVAVFTFASCQKTMDPQVDPMPVDSSFQTNGCRIIRMETDTFNTYHDFRYDDLGRIKYVASHNDYSGADTLFLFYEGNSFKLLKSVRASGNEFFGPLIYKYDDKNRLIEMADFLTITRINYINNLVDSTFILGPGALEEEANGTWVGYAHRYFYNDNKSAIFTSTYDGPNGVYMEYTSHKNHLKHLAYINHDYRLQMNDLFPDGIYGYVDDYLLLKHEGRSFNETPSGPEVDYGTRHDYEYEFDAKGNLSVSRTTIHDGEVFWKTITRKYFYECK